MTKNSIKKLTFISSIIPVVFFLIFLVKKLIKKDYKYHDDDYALFI